MSGEKSPTPQFVTKTEGQFIIALRLTPGEECLDIRVEDANTLQAYGQRVDNKFITENDGLKGFADYAEVYSYLSEHLGSVVFEDDSVKCGGERPITIRVRLQGSDWTELAHFRIDNTNKELQETKKELQNTKNRLQETQEKLAVANKQISALWEAVFPPPFFHHSGNSHAQYYSVTSTGKISAQLVRIGESSKWYNFVNGAEILPQQTAKYTLRMTKTANKHIMVGFCTSAGLGNINNHFHHESAYYFCNG